MIGKIGTRKREEETGLYTREEKPKGLQVDEGCEEGVLLDRLMHYRSQINRHHLELVNI